ncbi:hypothetical protein LCGC14_0889050 [marine sediment metagenome]|uniref:Uncharacterized protein n=1 Tax=marine sediment metagenome TaxID=412755 RepID=A0A0F9S6T8_9ZZZZ
MLLAQLLAQLREMSDEEFDTYALPIHERARAREARVARAEEQVAQPTSQCCPHCFIRIGHGGPG